MELDLDRVQANVRQATTEDLLDRATVYRDGMEPEALELIDRELARRGVRPADIAAHEEERRRRGLVGADGELIRCWKCQRPATGQGRGWYHLFWGLVPLWPRRLAFCEEHRPR
jgi:hypothetical protein